MDIKKCNFYLFLFPANENFWNKLLHSENMRNTSWAVPWGLEIFQEPIRVSLTFEQLFQPLRSLYVFTLYKITHFQPLFCYLITYLRANTLATLAFITLSQFMRQSHFLSYNNLRFWSYKKFSRQYKNIYFYFTNCLFNLQ